MAILKETSLGCHYFTIGMVLRESILMNSILLNVEVWFGITRDEIDKLEMCDKILIRRRMETARSTPVAGLYLENGATPLRFIIRTRRIMLYVKS